MEEIKNKVINSVVAQKLLLDLGIYPSKKGYLYLLASIQTFRESTGNIVAIYKKVAEQFGVRPICVERCIRFAVSQAFYTRSFVTLNKCFNAEIFNKDTYLSNGAFISTVATYLDMISAPRMLVVPFDYQEEIK